VVDLAGVAIGAIAAVVVVAVGIYFTRNRDPW
jgi:hypothetical protein